MNIQGRQAYYLQPQEYKATIFSRISSNKGKDFLMKKAHHHRRQRVISSIDWKAYVNESNILREHESTLTKPRYLIDNHDVT
mmetsp:Transcript_22412/g.54263  ORF Transcript_22412/g.54263 Transcript_22412/m.54263 type:complete len:82 (+) Transcript_22412:82-327(+)